MPTFYTATLFCKKSGIPFIFQDTMPIRGIETIEAHPRLPQLYSIIESHRANCSPQYLAGGILFTLLSTNRLILADKYPPTLMAEFNAALAKHPAPILYNLFRVVVSKCHSTKARERVPALNLASIVAGEWTILEAIASLFGSDSVPYTLPWQRAEKIAAALMRKEQQPTLTLSMVGNKMEAKQPKGNMSLTAIKKRLPTLLECAAKKLSTAKRQHLIGLEDRINTYLSQTEQGRIQLANLLRSLKEYGIKQGNLKSDTQIRSFEILIDLIENMELEPIEFQNEHLENLDDFIL